MLGFLVKPVYANCPVCIVTVGGGLFIAKKFGIDDLLVSLWISGLNTAIAFWIASRIKKKIWGNPLLWSISFYILTIAYLWYSKQMLISKNVFLGIDKTLFGMTIGLIIFLIATFIDKLIRYKNGGKVLFYYQKVIIPVVMLLLFTMIFRAVL